MSDTTQPSERLGESSMGRGERDALGLALVWSREEPDRAGDVLFVPADPSDGPWRLGREDGSARGAHRIGLVRQRPGIEAETGGLRSPRVSRVQLEVSPSASGALRVSNVGRCALLSAGREVSSAEVVAGDVLCLRDEAVFLCVQRPRKLGAMAPEYGEVSHAFGAPDAVGLVGESPAIWHLRAAMTALAERPVHVMVLGESGTGKELVAHGLHAASRRADKPYVARNAATIPEGVMDAELFGHARSFPNPGTPERVGLVGEANGGTLFLDEIGEMPASLQAHLLRLLDDGEYHRLGETRARKADIRVIAATNRSEEALKHDVLARFKARIFVPSLEARREDIPWIAAHLVRRQALSDPRGGARFFPGEDVRSMPKMTPELVIALVAHRYRTHVRELERLLLCAAIESRGKYLDLTPGVQRMLESAEASNRKSTEPRRAPEAGGDGPETFTDEEARRLTLFRKHGFHVAACAKDPEYGATRQTADLHLRQLMAKALGIAKWSISEAAVLLAGPAAEQTATLAQRVETFVFHLKQRILAEGTDPVRQALASEWRKSAPIVLRLMDAIAAGHLGR